MVTLPVFTNEEHELAHQLLAGRVAGMLGRKLEEQDWLQAYTGAKGIEDTGWSNLDIDIMHGSLGVEQKMLRVKSSKPIREYCGTNQMHPAGTRAIRLPDGWNERGAMATDVARDILQQYGALIRRRTRIVELRSQIESQQIPVEEAVEILAEDVGENSARRVLADVRQAEIPSPMQPPDMRFGWLLWQDALREFLYFEERMVAPDPEQYTAKWSDSGGGMRKTSRNLWVYNASDDKVFSITTSAGAKIQPYFKVPAPTDPNLYHFVVQGEERDGMVRVWLTAQTADVLRDQVGTLDPEALSATIARACNVRRNSSDSDVVTGERAVAVRITVAAYQALMAAYDGVSDEHRVQLCTRTIREMKS